MLLTAPVIARLTTRSRFAIARAIRCGEIPVARRKGRTALIELADAEQSLGVTFSPEQLVAAGLQPHRNPDGRAP
jgi:hypothetical protein